MFLTYCYLYLLFPLILRPQYSPLFPYTTLFRSISSSLITEKFSRAGGFSVTHGAHVGIGTLPIVFFGNHEQKEKYLPKLARSEEHTSELQSRGHLVCRLLLEKKKKHIK